jgi:hypothetical protein
VQGQIILNKCNEFAENWKIRLNPKKSNMVVFGTFLFKKVDFKLNRDKIEYTDNIKI